jgi:hypothetical protein
MLGVKVDRDDAAFEARVVPLPDSLTSALVCERIAARHGVCH